MNTALQPTKPIITHWVNPEPVEATDDPSPKMKIVREPKPAIMIDAATGKKLQVLSFARGDALEVEKPEELGLCEPCSLQILGYGFDAEQDLYAIVPGKVLSVYRTAAMEPGATEVVFKPPIPATCAEIYIKDYKQAFKLRRYEYKPEYDDTTRQIKINFNDNDLAA